MSRTTISIDPPILEEAKRIAQRENKTLRQVIGELLAIGLRASKHPNDHKPRRLKWHSQKMGARIDYTDKDELYRVLDHDR